MAECGAPIEMKEAPAEEPLGPRGIVNPHQATHHQQLIKDAIQDFQHCIEGGDVKYILKQLVEEMKSIISRVYEPINQADMLTILQTTPNPMCTALRLVSAKTEMYLEDVMPEEDIPSGEKGAAEISQIKAITYDQKDMLVLLFDDLSVVHERLSRVAGTVLSLCKVMSPEQLMLITKSSV